MVTTTLCWHYLIMASLKVSLNPVLEKLWYLLLQQRNSWKKWRYLTQPISVFAESNVGELNKYSMEWKESFGYDFKNLYMRLLFLFLLKLVYLKDFITSRYFYCSISCIANILCWSLIWNSTFIFYSGIYSFPWTRCSPWKLGNGAAWWLSQPLSQPRKQTMTDKW